MFKSTSKLDWPSVREIAKHYSQTTSKLVPELYEEMVGIAEGASVDVLDVVALNARSEIALGLFEDGCTSIGWKTEGDGVLLAQSKLYSFFLQTLEVVLRQEGKLLGSIIFLRFVY